MTKMMRHGHSSIYLVVMIVIFFLFNLLFTRNDYYIPPWIVFKGSHIPIKAKKLPQFDSMLLLKAAAIIDSGEMLMQEEIEELLKEANFLTTCTSSTSLSERILARSDEYKDWLEFKRECKEWVEFKKVLKDWTRRRIYQPDLMIELVRLVKHPLDKYYNHGLSNSYKKYESCAVVGNAKKIILLNKEYWDLIDTHDFVIRVEGFDNIMGSKTSISFISSNILNECAVNHDTACSSCQAYGLNVPTIMNIHQPAHLLDYIKCNSSYRAPLLVTDGRFDVLMSRIAKYYSFKRIIDEQSDKASFFDKDYIYEGVVASSAMRAVMLAVGVCDKVSLFSVQTNNDYFPSDHQSYVTGSHDYEAEYQLYLDLVNNPLAIPFISDKFEFLPVAIRQ